MFICRTLEGWTKYSIIDAWIDSSAAGLPTKGKPVSLASLPQYEITISKPSNGYLTIQQNAAVNTYKGKHSVYFVVCKIGGKMIETMDDLSNANTVVKSPSPAKSLIQQSECDFDKSVSYPYKFTMMVTTSETIINGEGGYGMKIFCDDPNLKIRRLNPVRSGDDCEC